MSYDVNGGKPWVDVRGYGQDVIAVLIENAPVFSTRRPGVEESRYVAVEMDVERAKRVRDALTAKIDLIEERHRSRRQPVDYIDTSRPIPRDM